MPRPRFVVKHFIACTNASWEGLPGPRTARTLEGVSYAYKVPPDAESPVIEFWLYSRLLLLNRVSGERRFSVDIYWLDAPDAKGSYTVYSW
jgi:hypothetical protein